MNIVTGIRARPPIVTIYGEPGVGKTTLVKDCITLDVEHRAGRVGGDRVDIESWDALLRTLKELRTEHRDRSVAIDTLDATEDMASQTICERNGEDSINAGKLAYNRGANLLASEFRRLIKACEDLDRPVYWLAHSLSKRFEDPMTGAYDRFVPNLNPATWGLVWRHSDAVLFARFAVGLRREQGSLKARQTLGDRELLTTKGAGYEAKNTFGLPESMPLDWSALQSAMNDSVDDLRERIKALVERCPEDKRDRARAYADTNDIDKLRAAEKRLKEIIK